MWIAAQLCNNRLKLWIQDGADAPPVFATWNPAALLEEQVVALLGERLDPDAVSCMICAGAPDAPLAPVPAAPDDVKKITSRDMRLSIFSLPCLTQKQPPDMMQGEEATVAGFIAEFPEWDGVLCLTGPFTRWVHISAGEVVSFRSFMTGELFEVLTQQSSLRDTVAGGGWDTGAFDQAVADTMSRPERLGASLAQVRAEGALFAGTAASGQPQISGCLIGAELAAARPYWLGQNVALIGEGAIVEAYAQALKLQGAMMQTYAADALTLRGLIRAYEQVSAR